MERQEPWQESVSFSHSGAFRLGAGTYLRFDALSGFGVAVLSNGEPTGVPEALGTLGENEAGPSAIQLVQENGIFVKVIDDWLNGSGPGLGEIARHV